MPPVSYSRFSQHVEALYEPPSKSRKTYLQMRQVLREFGELDVASETSDLDELMIIRWRRAHPDRKPWRERSLLISWRAACNIAVKKRWLEVSPFDITPLSKIVSLDLPDPVRHHSLAAIRKVLIHLRDESGKGWREHRLYALAATVAFTGVRAGEAQHAWVEDFRLGEGVFDISRRRKRKTPMSAAPVPIPDGLASILESWLPLAGCKWAFPGEKRLSAWTGGAPRFKPLDKLKSAALACGVPGFTFQSLRHSWATHAEGPWGMTDPQIQRNLRHTTIRTSKTYYRHADIPNLRAIGSKVTFDQSPSALSVVG